MIFTLTVCGSVETLKFMKWLGISIPRWLENDLAHASDILETSLAAARSAKSPAESSNTAAKKVSRLD